LHFRAAAFRWPADVIGDELTRASDSDVTSLLDASYDWRTTEPLGAAAGLLDELLRPLIGHAEHVSDLPDLQTLLV
jgi:hypothetical protein